MNNHPIQCKGLTQSGTQCKVTIGLSDGYCPRHHPATKTQTAPEPVISFENQPSPIQNTEKNTTPQKSSVPIFLFIGALFSAILWFIFKGKKRS